MPEGKRILICRDDKVGDLIVSLPVVETLRKSFPDSYLGMLVNRRAAELVKNHPALDEVIIDDSAEMGLWKLAERIRRSRFQTALMLFPSVRASFACLLAGIPSRIGPASKITQLTFTRRLKQHRSQCLKHEAEYNLELAACLGAVLTLDYSLPVDQEAESLAEAFWKNNRLASRTVIAVHPGSGGSSLNWSLERYDRLIGRLKTDTDMEVLVTWGTEEEKSALTALKSPFLEYSRDKYGIMELAALYKRCAVMISGNTGPMHLAAAVGTPTVPLFSPVLVSCPTRWRPLGNRQEIIFPDVPACPGCINEKCGYYPCMDRITPEQVLDAVSRIINGRLD